MPKLDEQDLMEERLSGKVILRNIAIAFVIVVYCYLFLVTLFDI